MRWEIADCGKGLEVLERKYAEGSGGIEEVGGFCMEAAGGKEEGGARVVYVAVWCAGEEYQSVDSVAEFARESEEGKRFLRGRGGWRSLMDVFKVWVWEGVYEVVVPFDHDEGKRRQRLSDEACRGSGRVIKDEVYLISCWADYGLVNVTMPRGAQLIGWALLSLLRARSEVFVCPANTTLRT
jgi:hypothetical protein